MGAPTPQDFGTWANGLISFFAGEPVVEWHGPPCPPVGMAIPNTQLGQLVFPRLVGRTFFNTMQGDCGGGLAEFGAYNSATNSWGVQAWVGVHRPDVEVVEVDAPEWVLTIRPDLPPPPAGELELTSEEGGDGLVWLLLGLAAAVVLS